MKVKVSRNAFLNSEGELVHRLYGHSVHLGIKSEVFDTNKKTFNLLAKLDLVEGEETPTSLIKIYPRSLPFFSLPQRNFYYEVTESFNTPSVLLLSSLWGFLRSQWKYIDIMSLSSQSLFSFSKNFFDPSRNEEIKLMSNVFDVGNLDLFCNPKNQEKIIQSVFNSLRKSPKKIITLAGTHEQTEKIISAIKLGPLDLILFDAHLDLGEFQHKGFLHSGNWVSKILKEHKDIRVFYYGVRDWETIHPNYKNRIFINPETLPSENPIYLSIDVDYFDPCFVSSVAYPTPTGDDFFKFCKILDLINFKKVIGVDISEYHLFFNIEKEHLFISRLILEILKRCAL